MRQPTLLMYLLCVSALLLGACAYDQAHGLQCYPAYAPGTAAYKACLMRQADTGDEGYAEEQYDDSGQ